MTTATTSADPVTAVRDWLDQNWDPDLTVAQWWERLGLAGWSAPTLPAESYGRGLSRSDAVAVAKAITDYGALNAPAGLGLLLAAPTITAHGTREQIDHYVRDIVTGQKAWCQLFSEPGAGSDLAGLSTRARPRRRRVDHQRAEGMDLARAERRPRDADCTHLSGRPQAQGDHLDGDRHAPATGRDRSAHRDDRARDVQRGVHDRCPGAARRGDRRPSTTDGRRPTRPSRTNAPDSAPAAERAERASPPARSPANSTDASATSSARRSRPDDRPARRSGGAGRC